MRKHLASVRSSIVRTWLAGLLAGVTAGWAAPAVPIPRIEAPWWNVAGDPDLGELTSPKQQPVDFAVWQAADGTWQLWSCIRHTKEPGKTRLLHGWEGKTLKSVDWKPMGIKMQAKPELGETPGGLQAPHVIRHAGQYHMFYGDWENICRAVGQDGKTFARQPEAGGKSGMFTEGAGNNTRDPMVIRVGNTWHCYYTAYPNRQGAVYCRTSNDLRTWNDSKVVAFGGQAGTNAFSAECPFVVETTPGDFYLFRTQRYGRDAKTSVYHSRDPMNFGINQDEPHLVAILPVAAPEILAVEGQHYVAALRPDLKGIHIARLIWEPPAAK